MGKIKEPIRQAIIKTINEQSDDWWMSKHISRRASELAGRRLSNIQVAHYIRYLMVNGAPLEKAPSDNPKEKRIKKYRKQPEWTLWAAEEFVYCSEWPDYERGLIVDHLRGEMTFTELYDRLFKGVL